MPLFHCHQPVTMPPRKQPAWEGQAQEFFSASENGSVSSRQDASADNGRASLLPSHGHFLSLSLNFFTKRPRHWPACLSNRQGEARHCLTAHSHEVCPSFSFPLPLENNKTLTAVTESQSNTQ